MNAKALLAITIALGAGATAIACVLADPPPIVTPPPAERPKIVVDSVSPPLDAILRTNPCASLTGDCFFVTVEADPNASVSFRVFVDLDPTGLPTQLPVDQGTDDGGVLAVGPDAATNGQRVVSFRIGDINFDPTQCHTITLIVAYGFVDNDFSKPITPPGGDTATWFYQPTNDCTFYDAGATD